MDEDKSKKENREINKIDERLVLDIPKDGIKSLFHLFVGRPDSEELVLNRLVRIKKEDIFRLYEKVCEKLDNHHVIGINTNIDVSFENGKTKQFGNWSDFKNFDWVTSEVTHEVLIKFDFLVNLPNFNMPQRHALSIRIMSSPNPLRVLRTVLSSDPDELDQLDSMKGPIICRVDFINNVLAKELLEIVKEWNNCCRKAFIENKFIKLMRKYPRLQQYFFKYLTVLVMSILSVAILFNMTEKINNNSNVTFGNFKFFVIWGLFTAIGLGFFNELRKLVFSYSTRAFDKYNRKYMVFDLTNGDQEKERDLIVKNSKLIWKYIFGVVFNILINIIAGVFVYYLFK